MHTKSKKTLLFALFLLVLLHSAVNAQNQCVDVFPYELDVGIYWLSMRIIPDLAADNSTDIESFNGINYAFHWQKSCNGSIAVAFDVAKPILLITHGLQPNMVIARERLHTTPDFEKLLIMWVLRGWNVGVFEYTQIADESIANFYRKESNIYNCNTYRHIEYKHIDPVTGELHISDVPGCPTITELYVAHYALHMAHRQQAYNGSAPPVQVHIVGHSLGGQLVINSAHTILLNPGLQEVTHVTALDMVMSPGRKEYIPQNIYDCYEIPELMGFLVSDLRASDTCDVDVWRGSFINKCLFSSENYARLVRNCIFVTLLLFEDGDQSIGSCFDTEMLTSPAKFVDTLKSMAVQTYNQHINTLIYYFKTASLPPQLCKRTEEYACRPIADEPPITAYMPQKTLHALMINNTDKNGGRLCYRQYDDGTRTAASPTMNYDPSDDLFFKLPCVTVNT